MQTSPELDKIVAAWFAAWENDADGGPSWAERYISQRTELTIIGSDPGEWFEGAEAFQHMKEEMNAGAGMKFLPGNIKTYEEGSVGWAAASPTLVLRDGKRVGMRWTVVFHREGDDWKMVLFHVSVGVPNEQLLG